MKLKLLIAFALLILWAGITFMILKKTNPPDSSPTSEKSEDMHWDKTAPVLMPAPTPEQTIPETKEQTASIKIYPAAPPDSNDDKNFQVELEKLMANPEFDHDTLENILREWTQIDPAAPIKWVRDSTFPDDRKTELLRIIDEVQK